MKRLIAWSLIRKADLLGAALLVVTAATWARLIPRYILEPDRWDEPAAYLGPGLNFFKGWSPFNEAQSGPLYALWYWVLSHAQSDPLKLYFLNIWLLAVMLPTILFLFCRSAGVSRLGGYLSGFLLLIFSPLITVNRLPNHFVTFILLLGFTIANQMKGKLDFIGTITLTTGLASLVRAEFQLSFMISLSIFLFFYTKKLLSYGRPKIPLSSHLISSRAKRLFIDCV